MVDLYIKIKLCAMAVLAAVVVITFIVVWINHPKKP